MNLGEGAPVYYRQLRLSNVKAFTEGTVLDLTLDGSPAPWTLILGENGLGKTTLLQCLALMRPILNVEQTAKTDARDPDRVEPALPAYDDTLLVELARKGDGLQVDIEAEFTIGREIRPALRPKGLGKRVTTSASFRTKAKDLDEFGFSKVKRKDFLPPLLVSYSAARHAPYSRTDVVSDQDDHSASLFNPEIELADAVQVLEDLDHLSLRDDAAASALYVTIKAALAKILPDVEHPDKIHVHGPPSPTRPEKPTGVWIETYSGEVPLHSLSVGYQTMFAWTVDLSWRMAQHHRTSADPLREAAIVLIDELDLHLHPKWQRRVRRDLSSVFPKVQFVVTTHSPVLAQTYLDTNIAIVQKDGDHATIDNDPMTVRSWRLDQVSVSLLHDEDPFAPEVVEAFETRRLLLAKKRLSPEERLRLAAADALVAEIPSDTASEDPEAVALIREAAQLLKTRPK